MVQSKRIYDPVHGFIHLAPLEKDLIDSYAFQRLHGLHQLGVSYLVYPGASHTRFEHSLGVMQVATKIFDKVVQKLPSEEIPPLEERAYWRQIVRFAALCHDLGHLPFSHTAEQKVLGLEGHEKWTMALIESSFLHPIWEAVGKQFHRHSVVKDVVQTAVGLLDTSSSPWEQVMSQVITGDFFGADRIDYLVRDSRCTGVSYGMFDDHQLIEMLCILPYETQGKMGLTLGIEENGMDSCEALLLARHFMHRRVYQYPSVKAYSFHMARFMEKIYREQAILSSLSSYLSYTDHEVLSELRKAFLDPKHLGHGDALSLFVREHRYEAIELPPWIRQEDVLAWKEQIALEEGMVEFSFIEEREKSSSKLYSFPVLSANHKSILDARSCFSLDIPTLSSNWLYVSPKYLDSVEVLLEEGTRHAKN